MGMGARASIAERLRSAGRSDDTPVAVVHWGTTDRQQIVRTDLAHLADVDLPAPAAIVIGPVAGLDVTAGPAPAGD
jgi:siroheme synthase